MLWYKYFFQIWNLTLSTYFLHLLGWCSWYKSQHIQCIRMDIEPSTSVCCFCYCCSVVVLQLLRLTRLLASCIMVPRLCSYWYTTMPLTLGSKVKYRDHWCIWWTAIASSSCTCTSKSNNDQYVWLLCVLSKFICQKQEQCPTYTTYCYVWFLQYLR